MRGEAQARAAAEGVRETIGVALLMYAGSTPDGQRAPRRWGRPQHPHTHTCILTGKGRKARKNMMPLWLQQELVGWAQWVQQWGQ